ncbi:MAG: lamin tail domain-containing protein [Candidatus Cloacimonetes bacterium]|nr:lamin tail domain-containing protein [Candidatus Cloacimonadota bacterium]
MKKLILLLGFMVVVMSVFAVQTDTYGWEDGGTVLGTYGNVGSAENSTEQANSGTSSLKLTEDPIGGTPQAWVWWVTGIADGDIIDASFYCYDVTPSASPSGRIWGHYTSDPNDIDTYAGSASGNSTYSDGSGWSELSHQWTVDTDGGARTGIVVEARIYSSEGANVLYFDDTSITVSSDTAVIHRIEPGAALPVAGDIYISEVSDNLGGEAESTGYVELFNRTQTTLDLSDCTLVQGTETDGVFTASGATYTIPLGTTLDARAYLTIGNGADQATFETAWGTTISNYLDGIDLGITSGSAYQFNNTVVRAELDHSPNVLVNEQAVQMTVGGWVSGGPGDSTPGVGTTGQTLPVELSSFSALVTTSQTVMLEWVTQTETNMIGYNVLRGETNSADLAACVTINLIPATNSTEETSYNFEDIEVMVEHTYYYWLEGLGGDGSSDLFGPVYATISPEEEDIPDFFELNKLNANYPNPFNPETNIDFSIRGAEDMPVNADLVIFNIRGQRVRTLHTGLIEPGDHSIIWFGNDDNGNEVGSGLYFYRLSAPGFVQMRKMMLIK